MPGHEGRRLAHRLVRRDGHNRMRHRALHRSIGADVHQIAVGHHSDHFFLVHDDQVVDVIPAKQFLRHGSRLARLDRSNFFPHHVSYSHVLQPKSARIRGAMKKTCLFVLFLSTALAAKDKPFSVVEATIPQMQAAMKSGRVTSHDLVQQYLTRIAIYEDRLHAAITVNPNALKEADERDRERKAGKIRGPLHGIPIAIKDNIQTTDMPTTGGALALADYVP